MRRLLLVLAVLFAAPAFAQGAAKPTINPPTVVIDSFRNAALNNAVNIGHAGPLARPLLVTSGSLWVVTGSGGGAANTVITLTDGTNTCTLTVACTASQTTGVKPATVANGAGTGCMYAAGASITASVTTAGCTTTQPSAMTIKVYGLWK